MAFYPDYTPAAQRFVAAPPAPPPPPPERPAVSTPPLTTLQFPDGSTSALAGAAFQSQVNTLDDFKIYDQNTAALGWQQQ
jgi:hypothetical protein